MERTKYLFVILFSLFTLVLFGQNNKSIYQAYVNGNMDKWKYAMDSLEAIKTISNKENLDLINYQYGYIAWCISNKKKSEAEKYMNKSKKLIELLEKQHYNLSMLYAYKAALVGFEIGISPYKAPFIGQQSLSFANQSVDFDSLNALAYMQLGNIAFYTPKMLGGSKPEAIQYYFKALKIMQEGIESTNGNWNYLNLLATIINANMELKQYELAKKYCLETLAIEPQFDWVKNELYPEILKNIK